MQKDQSLSSNEAQTSFTPQDRYQSTYSQRPDVKQVRSAPRAFEQSYEARSQNYLGFLRSYQYFQRLISGQLDDTGTSLNADTVMDPLRSARRNTNVVKGLFCSNRECCSLILDVLGRSPYCCKQCQIREQNMRQSRVKFRESMIRRKEALFNYLLRLNEDDFERAKVVSMVGIFLSEYSKEFGDI